MSVLVVEDDNQCSLLAQGMYAKRGLRSNKIQSYILAFLFTNWLTLDILLLLFLLSSSKC